MRKYMTKAICSALEGIRKNQGGPFGACIVLNHQVVAVGHNTVIKNHDSTCHAEINAIRFASRKLKTFDLSGCVIYSTTEPCPMCLSAIHWARVSKIVYGTTIRDVKKRGFNELMLSARELIRLSKSPLRVVQKYRRECLGLLAKWDQKKNKQLY